MMFQVDLLISITLAPLVKSELIFLVYHLDRLVY